MMALMIVLWADGNGRAAECAVFELRLLPTELFYEIARKLPKTSPASAVPSGNVVLNDKARALPCISLSHFALLPPPAQSGPGRRRRPRSAPLCNGILIIGLTSD